MLVDSYGSVIKYYDPQETLSLPFLSQEGKCTNKRRAPVPVFDQIADLFHP